MAMEEKRKSGGGKLSRSETVTVRLDPKLRYLAELAARKQRRTLSSFIEWAIEDALGRVQISEGSGNHNYPDLTVGEEGNRLWDVDDADRFVKLAIRYPELLTHEEQVLWKLIRENGALWRGNWRSTDGNFYWSIKEESLLFEKLRGYWDTFKKVVGGECQKSDLPTWIKNNPEAKSGFNDIPF